MAEEGLRFNAGKARWDLLPVGPLSEIVNVFTYGSIKYADNNWRKGFKYMSVMASMMRHLFCWVSGETVDAESGLHHMAHVAWNAIVLIEFDNLKRTDLDNRPKDAMGISPIANIKQPPGAK